MGVSKEEKREEELNVEENCNVSEQENQDNNSGNENTKEINNENIFQSEKIQKLEEENILLKDALLRKQAELENYRKRMIKEKEETVKFANSNLLLDIVGIIDDFERAISSAEESKDFDNFHKGIILIEKQFTAMLDKKWGLKRIDSLNDIFNPEMHEALMAEESGDIKEAVVGEVFQSGYVLNSRIIRNAKVKVLMPGKNDEPEKETDKE